MSATKILVTAATGTTGQWVTRYLTESKDPSYEVYAAVRNPDSDFSKELTKFGAKLVGVDFDDQGTLEAAVKGMDKVVFITPLVANHQTLSEQWVAAISANKGSLKQIIRLSIVHADNPTTLIEKWHALTEVLLKATDVPTTFVRPGFFFQNVGNHYGATIKATQKHFFSVGDAAIAYVDARDVAAVVVAVASDAKWLGKAVPVQGQTAITQEDICKTLSEVLEKKIDYVDIPAEQAVAGLVQAGVPEVLADISKELQDKAKADKEAYAADTSVKDVLGRDAKTFADYAKTHKFQFQ